MKFKLSMNKYCQSILTAIPEMQKVFRILKIIVKGRRIAFTIMGCDMRIILGDDRCGCLFFVQAASPFAASTKRMVTSRCFSAPGQHIRRTVPNPSSPAG